MKKLATTAALALSLAVTSFGLRAFAQACSAASPNLQGARMSCVESGDGSNISCSFFACATFTVGSAPVTDCHTAQVTVPISVWNSASGATIIATLVSAWHTLAGY